VLFTFTGAAKNLFSEAPMTRTSRIGLACSYTPLPLILAAGFCPHRISPVTEVPEHAGVYLHDNMCPHVKRLLDRAISGDLPELKGVVFMNSCESMRRLYDAWRLARPADESIIVDLPATRTGGSVEFFSSELETLAAWLFNFSDKALTDDSVESGIAENNRLVSAVESLSADALTGRIPVGRGTLQRAYNAAVTSPAAEALAVIEGIRADAADRPVVKGAPVYMFGNVLPIPEVFDLIEGAGMRIVDDDICTGARQLTRIPGGGEKPVERIARAVFGRAPCARTVDPGAPDMLARMVGERAASLRVRGVIGHVAKFCDPYLARLPEVRALLKKRGIPFLLLEGDCTLGSIGQQRTRIEAFSEMLGGDRA
jgi:benzoyl-CoA reductase/2-hydroxyglutaryl-CoA dehydratase subunit BcrC/BadD/HgdB